jgi:hypothetical protein
MLPRYQGSTTTEEPTGGGRSRGRTQQPRDGHDYLKWTHLSADPKTAKVLACRLQPDNFKPKEQLIMTKLSLDGQTFLFPLRLNNPNLQVLQNAFGYDENEWIDKKFHVFAEEDEVTGQHRIAVEAPIKDKGAKGK